MIRSNVNIYPHATSQLMRRATNPWYLTCNHSNNCILSCILLLANVVYTLATLNPLQIPSYQNYPYIIVATHSLQAARQGANH